AEDALLLRPRQPRLETDQVPCRACLVLPSQLDDRVRPRPGPRVLQAHRLHRPEREHVAAALGHYLDREAALEIASLFELVRLDLLAAQQLLDEAFVLLAIERQV